MKDHIVIVTAVFPPEPVVSANLSYDIAIRLSEKNNIVVLSPKPSRPYGFNFCQVQMLSKPFKHKILDSYTFPLSKLMGRIRESYSFGKATANYISEYKNDIRVIYANTWPLFGQFFLIREAKKYHLPIVLHVQDIYPDSLTKKLNRLIGSVFFSILLPLDRYILKNSTKVICISKDMIAYLQKSRKIKLDKFVMARNWQNDEILTQKHVKKESTNFVFMYLGSISASAGVETLIKAFDKAGIKNSKLVIAGSGNDKMKCEVLAASLQNDTIIFCDVRQEEVGRMQSEADVLLLPLKKDVSLTATPSKLTAYMFSGKPIIACVEAESDTAKILFESGSGLICDPEDVEQLSFKMREISGFAQYELKRMGNSARVFANENLSKRINLDKIVATIENVIW